MLTTDLINLNLGLIFSHAFAYSAVVFLIVGVLVVSAFICRKKRIGTNSQTNEYLCEQAPDGPPDYLAAINSVNHANILIEHDSFIESINNDNYDPPPPYPGPILSK